MKKLAVKFLMFVAIAAMFAIFSFRNSECQHVYVLTIQPYVKVERPHFQSELDNLMPLDSRWPNGKQEGAEIVCIKCFHITHQILDYSIAVNDRSNETVMPDSAYARFRLFSKYKTVPQRHVMNLPYIEY